MSPLDILEYTRRKPFVPFRLIVSDGSTYEVGHPDLCMVAQTTVTVGLPAAADHAPAADHLIDAFHIVKLIPLPRSFPGGGPAEVPPLEA